MTRINCINTNELTNKHLVAEYRELPRIFALAENAFLRGEKPNDAKNPKQYVLGKGHCRFFYNKLGWLTNRHTALCAEMLRRGYVVNFPNPPLTSLSNDWYGDWKPTDRDISINRERIRDRLSQS